MVYFYAYNYIMSVKVKTYLNQMLEQTPQGAVITSVWLKTLGISNSLQQSYRNNGWIYSIGNGAFVKYNDTPTLNGAVYTMQNQLALDVHFGAKSALVFHGMNHFIQLENFQNFLFSNNKIKQPKWFIEYFKHNNYQWIKTDFLPSKLGITVFNDVFPLNISTPERAILEMIYLSPDIISLKEVYQTLELLVNLRPKLLQELLESCSSIKVKRLFLYMAEKVNHDWFASLKIEAINLGSGKRIITKGGKLDTKYNIVIEELGEI